jgi:hypothetical protein
LGLLVDVVVHRKQRPSQPGHRQPGSARTGRGIHRAGDESERFFAAASAIWCLPQGPTGPDPEPVGALIRPADVRDLAARAGHASVEVLPIEHPSWRFYRLVP